MIIIKDLNISFKDRVLLSLITSLASVFMLYSIQLINTQTDNLYNV